MCSCEPRAWSLAALPFPKPFGLTVLEGLWYGTPVVAPALGGPLEIVGNPPAALLHTPGDASELGGQRWFVF